MVCRAFAAGCQGGLSDIDYKRPPKGPVAVYGILRRCDWILRAAESRRFDRWYIDHGYFGAEPAGGYYRIVKNGLCHDGWGQFPDDRLKQLNVDFKPFGKRGNAVLFIPPSAEVCRYLDMPSIVHPSPDYWVERVKREARKYTTRPFYVRFKDSDVPLEADLAKAHVVVTYHSTVGVKAICAGVPVICLGPSPCRAVAETRLHYIERPFIPDDADRYQWAANLAYGQFTLDEMRSGEAWRLISSQSTSGSIARGNSQDIPLASIPTRSAT